METQLFKSAIGGDAEALGRLLQNDASLLQRVSLTSPHNTPLHVAAFGGHLSYVEEILRLNPHLAAELNSQQESPLHVASSQGEMEIAKRLVQAAPHMCLARDSQGRNPLHLAAIKGEVKLLEELVSLAPSAARQKVGRGLTVLHLCVEHGQLEALMFFMDKVKELINAKNDDGDTILHMAVAGNNIEIMEYLLINNSLDITAQNSYGQTAKTLSEQILPEPHYSRVNHVLRVRLKRFKARIKYPMPREWLSRKFESIMVVAILIATITFQAGMTPPGGVWQDDFTHYGNGTLAAKPHRAGEAVLAYKSEPAFKNFMRTNTVAFVSSISTIGLLVTDTPFRHPAFMWLLMLAMASTVFTTVLTYTIAIFEASPAKDHGWQKKSVESSEILAFCYVLIPLAIFKAFGLIDRLLKKRGVVMWRPRMCRDLVEEDRGQAIV